MHLSALDYRWWNALRFLFLAVVELWYIPLLLRSFDVFGLGLNWQTWFSIHELLVLTLTIVVALLALIEGFIGGSTYMWIKNGPRTWQAFGAVLC